MLPARSLLAGAVACLGLASSAHAATVKSVTYGVVADGQGTYAAQSGDGVSSYHRVQDASFTWHADLGTVELRGDRAIAAGSASGTTATATGRGTAEFDGSVAGCDVTGVASALGGRIDAAPTVNGDPALHVQALGGLSLAFDGCDDAGFAGFDLPGAFVEGHHTFAADVTVPAASIGAAHLVRSAHAEVADGRCPNNQFGEMSSCRLSFDVGVTFDKLSETTVEDTPAPSGPGTSPTPTVIDASPAAPIALDDTPILDRKHHTLTVPVKCAAACDGTLVVQGRGGTDARGDGRTIARRAFSGPAGKVVAVGVRFGAKAWKRVLKTDGVFLTASAKAGETSLTVPLAAGPGRFKEAKGRSTARGVHYKGRTNRGTPIEFTVRGGKVYDPKGGVGVSCLPIQGGGTPSTGVDLLDAHGSAKLGADSSFAYLQKVFGYYNDVTVNHRFTTRRGRGGVITGQLRFQYEYMVPKYMPGTFSIYSCVGSATFKARPA